MPCKVNLIEYNPIGIGDDEFKQADNEAIERYIETKPEQGHIDAACGQLANKQ